MTQIRLYNTRTRREEPLTPVEPGKVSMYVCGPTVYDRAHLGNARPVLVFDVLYRLLRHVYGTENVTYIRNFTDVDDRINETAQKRKAAGADGTLEELIHERADETIRWYHEDMDALGALRPTREPRATEYIAEMVAMIEGLIASGNAYPAEGHVLFAVESYADYGKLSGRSVDDMIAGARVEVAPYKRNPMDFVLWKPSPDDLPGWDSPWGRGRPGWHIECSAMSAALLGETFDIHGGGNDLQFPHHENEIAQSRCAHPEGDFAKIWMHNEMLQVEGKKMSKSLGNFFTVRDLLDQGVPGEVIRFVMLSTHYRKPMDWTEAKRREAEGVLRKWRGMVDDVEDGSVPKAVLLALADDLNTAGAIAELHRLATVGDAAGLRAGARIFGLLTHDLGGWDGNSSAEDALADAVPLIEQLLQERLNAKKAKNFPRADAIRNQMSKYGLALRDAPEGTTWEPQISSLEIKLEDLGLPSDVEETGRPAAMALETERRILEALTELDVVREPVVLDRSRPDAVIGSTVIEVKRIGEKAYVHAVLVPLLEDLLGSSEQ